MGEIRYSDEQKLIINKPAKVGNTVVIAYAGCGKSTTLIGFAYARKGKRILYLVFNRSAAKDAEKKFPKFVDVLTMNGLAYRSKTSDGLRERIAKKLSYILFLDDLKEIEPNSERRILLAKHGLAIVETWCASAQDAPTINTFPDSALSEIHTGNFTEDILNKAALVIVRSMIQGTEENVSHSLYLKIFQLSRPKLAYDVIMVDEAQDLNPVVTAILSYQTHAEIVRVGDPHQGIYEFRGASDAGMKVPGADYFYLTNTYRFGPQIAEAASVIIQTYKGAEKPIVGRGKSGNIIHYTPDVQGLEDDPTGRSTMLRELWNCGDGEGAPMLLSRTKSGMVSLLINRLVDRSDAIEDDSDSATGSPDRIYMPGGLDSYGFNELMDAWALFKKGESRGMLTVYKSWSHYSNTAEATNDQSDLGIINLIERYKGMVPTVLIKAKAHQVKKPEQASVIITTMHKSKGLEAERVFVNDDVPDFSDTEGDVISLQEINIMYVAITRAERAVYIPRKIRYLTEGHPVSRLEGW